MTPKKIYFGGSTLISFLLLLLLPSSDFKSEISGNLSCMGSCLNPDMTDCIGYFNITAVNRSQTIRNKGNLDIPFSDSNKVRSFKIEKKINNSWDYVNLSKTQTYKVDVKNEFRIKLCKVNAGDSVKWGMKTLHFNEDPVFLGITVINVSKIQTCVETNYSTKEETKTVITPYIFYVNNTFCSDFPINKSCSQVVVFNRTNYFKNVYIDYINLTSCNKYSDSGFKIGNKTIDFFKYGWKGCSIIKTQICCEAPYQSNGNGLCESGEGYCLYDILDLQNPKCTISKTPQIRRLIIE